MNLRDLIFDLVFRARTRPHGRPPEESGGRPRSARRRRIRPPTDGFDSRYFIRHRR